MMVVHKWRRVAYVFLFLVFVVLGCSFIYNFPIRVRAKWDTALKGTNPWHPSAKTPDNIILTPAENLTTGMAVTWRTGPDIENGMVQYAALDHPDVVFETAAVSNRLKSPEMKKDRSIFCHSSSLQNLRPGTAYRYRVGDKATGNWSDYSTFTTASDSGNLRFVYLGDVQLRQDRVGAMLSDLNRRHAGIAFYLLGGDLVDMGDLRNLWDELAFQTGKVFSRVPVAPAFGNHDAGDWGQGRVIFQRYFALPDHVAGDLDHPMSYSFSANSAYIIVLDTNQDRGTQTVWLERELEAAGAKGHAFTIVMFHEPVYNTKAGRDHPGAKELWVPLFDKYGVDLVLSGHDHNYLRTLPMRGGQVAGEGGTVYITANGCEKHKDFIPLSFAAKQFTAIPTYQLIDISVDGSGMACLRFEARDGGGSILDAFELRKAR